MDSRNPYKSPAPESELQSWQRIDFFAAGLWIAIPIAVFVGRKFLLPMFDDFGVELSASSQYMLSFWSPVMLAIACLVFMLAMFTGPYGITRRRVIRLATMFGMVVGVIIILSVLGPVLTLWRD